MQVAEKPPSSVVTVTTAVPAETPLTVAVSPDWVPSTTEISLVDQLTVWFVASAGDMTAVRVALCPTASLRVAGDTVMPVTGFGPGGGGGGVVPLMAALTLRCPFLATRPLKLALGVT